MTNSNRPVPQERRARIGSSAALLIFITVLFALSLLSFSPLDISSLSFNTATPTYPSNLLGMFGAKTIWGLLLTFGLATHVTFALMIICCVRRFFYHNLIYRTSWEYYLALFFFLFSTSILCSTWHEPLESLAAYYNIASLPGGLVGDLISGPQGFLLIVLNKVGITIVCLMFIACLLAYFYVNDWAKLIKFMSDKIASKPKKAPKSAPETPEAKEKPVTEGEHSFPLSPDTPPQIQQDLPLSPVETMPPEPARPAPAPAPRQTPPVHAAPVPAAEQSATAATQSSEGLPYQLPSVQLLKQRDTDKQTQTSEREIEANRKELQSVLDAFSVDGTVVSYVVGPQVTMYKIQMAPGVKVDKLKSLEDNIRMALCAKSIRIQAPIPGENLVGVDIPNKTPQLVSVRSLMEDKQWQMTSMGLPLLLGKNTAGKPIMIDLCKAPHLLIAGATGTGKSVCMNLIILSLLYKHTPETLKIIMVDPKKVEFSIYQHIPHLLVPVITDNSKVAMALRWACDEMEHRYQMLKVVGARNLETFNNRTNYDPNQQDENGNPIPRKLPFIVIIIDELADIMLTSRAEVEGHLSRIAALARAVGIHAILATQRPDVKVITGTIKSNFPVRIAFRVASQIDSQTIINTKGAESLLGNGDMIYKPAGIGLERIQGGMADDDERNQVVDFIDKQNIPQTFVAGMFDAPDQNGGAVSAGEPAADDSDAGNGEKSLYDQAVDIVLTSRKTSISYLQRRLRVGYNKAATLIEEMEKNGIISSKNGNGTAEILVDTPPSLSDNDDLPEDEAEA